jgi:hypothetical protein
LPAIRPRGISIDNGTSHRTRRARMGLFFLANLGITVAQFLD